MRALESAANEHGEVLAGSWRRESDNQTRLVFALRTHC